MNTYNFSSPVGTLCVAEENGAIIGLHIDNTAELSGPCRNELIKKTVQELSEYFSGTRTSFDVPVNPSGTAFQMRVWEQLRLIPCGQTRSYGDIAKAVGNQKAARAVGHANNRNPIMIIIPCHRVIGADGSLVGFGGGIEAKQFLLDLEAHHA
ncbi:MAG TPA: cysteine methyltransferase [Treponema sp.]|nr:cysteine methyltransferase [Treponema sp.]